MPTIMTLVFEPNLPSWQFVGTLNPTGASGTGEGQFSKSVSITPDGSYMAVGAWRANFAGTRTGSVYIYTRSGNTWVEQQRIDSPTGETDASFGRRVGISDAGDHLVIGHPGFSSEPGRVHVYNRTGSTWTSARNSVGFPQAGGYAEHVVMSGNGDIAAVRHGGTGQDRVDIFANSGGSWTLTQTLTDVFENQGGLSISDDGNTLLVGETRRNSFQGFVGVYSRSGGTFSRTSNIGPPSPSFNSDSFGEDLDISGDGLRAIVGRPGRSSGRGDFHLYERADTASAFSFVETIDISTATNDRWGDAVAMNTDGSTFVVGADGAGTIGEAYVYDLDGSSYTQTAPLTQSPAPSRHGDMVAISGNGTVAAVGNAADNVIYMWVKE